MARLALRLIEAGWGLARFWLAVQPGSAAEVWAVLWVVNARSEARLAGLQTLQRVGMRQRHVV